MYNCIGFISLLLEVGTTKKQSVLLFVMVVLLAASASAGTYSGGGDGSVENPYRIATAADMNEIGDNPGDDWL